MGLESKIFRYAIDQEYHRFIPIFHRVEHVKVSSDVMLWLSLNLGVFFFKTESALMKHNFNTRVSISYLNKI